MRFNDITRLFPRSIFSWTYGKSDCHDEVCSTSPCVYNIPLDILQSQCNPSTSTRKTSLLEWLESPRKHQHYPHQRPHNRVMGSSPSRRIRKRPRFRSPAQLVGWTMARMGISR